MRSFHRSRLISRSSLGFAGIVAATQATPAFAQEECGPPDGAGTVVCEAMDEPYTAIRYENLVDTAVLLREGVVVDNGLAPDMDYAVLITGDGSISLHAEDGTLVNGTGFPAIEIGSTAGNVDVRVDQVFGLGTAISAFAGGDVTVRANQVGGSSGIDAYSLAGNVFVEAGLTQVLGEGGIGIYAHTEGDGSITVHGAEVYAAGDFSAAVVAESLTGDISVEVGNAFGEGIGSSGIWAVAAEGGDVQVAAGTASAFGDFSVGIVAGAIFGNVDVTAGYIFADGFQGGGIIAGADTGTINIDVLGAGGSGDFTRAIQAESVGDISILASEYIGTFGSFAEAIYAVTSENLSIQATRVYTYGEGSTGIYVAAGNAQIDVAELETASTAVAAIATGDLDVRIGRATMLSPYVETVALELAAEGNLSLRIDEHVIAETGRAIKATAASGDFSIVIAEGASISSADTAIEAGSAISTVLDIQGTVESQYGPAIRIRDNEFGVAGSADVRIGASGLVRGTLILDIADDTVTNDGRLLTSGESDFGDGDDRLVNNRVLALAEGEASSIAIRGLERLENAGLISLANGRAGDSLTLEGRLQGAAGSEIALDLDLEEGLSDLVEVDEIAGVHNVTLNLLGEGSGLGLNGIRVLTAGTTEAGTEITISEDSRTRGFISFALEHDGQDSWYLASDLGDAAYLSGAMAEGLRDLFHMGLDALSSHLVATRAGSQGAGAWIQAIGSDVRAQTSLSHEQGSRTLRWDGSHEGVQLGIEKAFAGWQVGFTAGYGSARFSLGADENSRFGIVNAGLYASYFNNGWFGGATLRADLVDVKSDWATAGLEDSGNGSMLGLGLEGGYRGGLGGLWFEPALRLSWIHASLPEQQGLSGEIAWDGTATLTGEANLRIGAEEGVLGMPLRPFVAMSLARELSGGDGVLIDLGAEEAKLNTEGSRTHGRLGAGVAYSRGRFDLYTQIDGRFGDIEGVSGTLGGRVRF